MMTRFDVLVLGAGIVGIATAIHLQRAGLSVALADRRDAGEETSFGNAGIIQREGVHPYLFPRDPMKILRAALRLDTETHYHITGLPQTAPFLWRYFMASAPARARETLAANIPLFAHCLAEHEELARASGALDLISRNGWIALFRDGKTTNATDRQILELRDLGLDSVRLDMAALAQAEPHLDPSRLESAVHFRDPWTVSDPGALVKAHAGLFEREGGSIINSDANRLTRDGARWRLDGLQADRVVVALGPWTKPFLELHGLRLPMGLKRGYHMHFKPSGNAFLTRPVVDDTNGFVLAPMARGIRLTTGAEFARHDAPPTPVQLAKVLPRARQLLPLGDAVEDRAWMGARPVFPDMRPVIGPAPGIDGMWLNFGHAHHGFTLGPASGKLLAQLMSEADPLCDPVPFSASRFG